MLPVFPAMLYHLMRLFRRCSITFCRKFPDALAPLTSRRSPTPLQITIHHEHQGSHCSATEAMRERGLRQFQVQVPDARTEKFKSEAGGRRSLLLPHSGVGMTRTSSRRVRKTGRSGPRRVVDSSGGTSVQRTGRSKQWKKYSGICGNTSLTLLVVTAARISGLDRRDSF